MSRSRSTEERVTTLLAGCNSMGGYPLSLVCTEQGLLIAAAGEAIRSERTAGLTSLFDDIVRRAVRDLGFQRVDELTLLDPEIGRYVIRPLPLDAATRLFLVVQVPRRSTWRRNTNILVTRLVEALAPLVAEEQG